MTHKRADRGDSGGPWFKVNRAYGVHEGWKWWFGDRDRWSSVALLSKSVSVSVLTC